MKVVDCIIPEPRFKMYPEISVPVNVIDCIILELRFKTDPVTSVLENVC